MKHFYRMIIAMLVVATLSCKAKRGDISGTYVRTIDHEFARGRDTLILKGLSGPIVQIEKRSKYQRITEGKLSEPVVHRRIWTGMYDRRHRLIREYHRGQLWVLSEDKKRLSLGGSEYMRIDSRD